MSAADYAPGFEALAACADPLTLYAAFLGDTLTRYRATRTLRDAHADLWKLLETEERRVRATHPSDWAAGASLLRHATW